MLEPQNTNDGKIEDTNANVAAARTLVRTALNNLRGCAALIVSSRLSAFTPSRSNAEDVGRSEHCDTVTCLADTG